MMDSLNQGSLNSINRFQFDHAPNSCSLNRNLCEEIKLNPQLSHPQPPVHPVGSDPFNDLLPLSSSSGSSLEGDNASNNPILKFISDILMEEDVEDKTCMLQDCLALQAAEKSLYDALGHDYPNPSVDFASRLNYHNESPDDSFSWNRSVDCSNSRYYTHNTSVEKSNLVFDQDAMKDFLVDSPESTLGPYCPSEVSPFEVVSKGTGDSDEFFAVQENSLISGLGSTSSKPPNAKDAENSGSGSRGRKNHLCEDSDYAAEERSNKQSALSLTEPEPAELFDAVLLQPESCSLQENSRNGARGNGQRKGFNGRTTRAKKQGKGEDVVDLWTLLTQCAQAVSSRDQRSASDVLKQIRQNSSPYGDGNQRMAHYFANALEKRLAGAKTPAYSALISSSKRSGADILKGYRLLIETCPFKRMSFFLADNTILKQAEKATGLHIIDFGIGYGFQWPCLIQQLSERPGGPPKLRITGIEFPQPGFRPRERVEETGRRLERYCERFNVPFKFHVIAQKWETIKVEDLNIDRDEMTIVNCFSRMCHLPDDTLAPESPRDTVLQLIRRINPALFIHGILNGTYNAPFFVTRFREALFHFSSLFDIFEENVESEDVARLLFEEAIFGRDIMNVVACEGTERVERPETYKQWQFRTLRAGFRQIRLGQWLVKKVKSMVEREYHRDFIIDVDGQWMLQGWKGRIIEALSIWKPVQE